MNFKDHFVCLSTEVASSPTDSSGNVLLPFGAILTPEPLPGSKLLALPRAAAAECDKCDAYACSHSAVDPVSQKWVCPFCLHSNPTAQGVADLPEAVDYVGSAAEASEPQNWEPVRILALDLASSEEDIDRLKTAVAQALEDVPDYCRVALMAVGELPCAFRLGPQQHEQSSGKAAHLDYVLTDYGTARHAHVAPLGQCREQLRAALSTLRPHSGPWAERMGLEGRLEAVVRAGIRLAREKTCLRVSLQQQTMQRPQNEDVVAQLVLVTAGSSNVVGNGSIDGNRANGSSGSLAVDEEEREEETRRLSLLSSIAAEGRLVVDVAAVTRDSSGLAWGLGVVAQGTGGLFIPLAVVGSALSANLSGVLARQVGAACMMEVRCSPGVKVARALGPLAPISADGEKAAEWEDADGPQLASRLLGRSVWSFLCDPPDTHQSPTLLLEAVHIPSSRHDVFMQVCLHWNRADGCPVTRVITRQLAAPQKGEAPGGRGMRWGPTAALVAKEVAWVALEERATHNRMRAEILRRRLLNRLQEVSRVLGRPDASSMGWISGPSHYALPQGSLPLAQVIYFLHHCALQHGPLGDDSAREVFLQRLLTAPLETAARMCRPELQVLLPPARAKQQQQLSGGVAALLGPALELQPAPATDLALALSIAAVVDAGDAVFVWVSKAAEGQQRVVEVCMQQAQQAACSRHSQADVIVARLGTVQEAQMLARMVPIYSDPLELQMRQLPMLSGFSKAEINAAVTEVAERSTGPSLADWLWANNMRLPPGTL